MAITTFNSEKITRFGRQMLRDHHTAFDSFEDASQQVVTDIFNTFKLDNDDPNFALVRVYRVSSEHHELLPDLQDQISSEDLSSLALMGTIGIEDDWCDRTKSENHGVVPVGKNTAPMFLNVFRSLGDQWQKIMLHETSEPEDMADATKSAGYFFVPQALGSEIIPDQEFVEEYGIGSVIAIGGFFISQAAYVLIGFTRRQLEDAEAAAFADIAPFVATLLAAYDGRGTYWQQEEATA